MRRLHPLLLPALLWGCGGGQLAALEEDQDSLRRQYTDLEANVVALRAEMVDAGLVNEEQAQARTAKSSSPPKSGKAKTPKRKGPGNPRPKEELSDALAWTASRTGTLPELPDLPEIERTETPCGYKFVIESLQPISDYPLNRDGLGKSGPLLLLEDGKPLTSHAMPEDYEGACKGAFRHAGFAILFSPTGTVDDAPKRTYSIALDDTFPMTRGGDERPMYWVFPGTTATFTFEGGWNPDWGEAELGLSGRIVTTGKAPATVTAPGLDDGVDGVGGFSFDEALTLDADTFNVVVSSPENGPWLVIDLLTIGNPGHAVVVTAEAAWASRNK